MFFVTCHIIKLITNGNLLQFLAVLHATVKLYFLSRALDQQIKIHLKIYSALEKNYLRLID